MNPEVLQRANKISLLMLDADGVLTDGKIYYGNYGDQLQSFDVQDGMGMWLWQQAGLPSVVLSGRRSKMLTRRAKEMHITKVFQGVENKERVYLTIIQQMGKLDEEVCFIGDDVMDIPLLGRVGLGIAVANAVSEVKESAHYVTVRSGGNGAVREVVDLLLKSTGKWDEVIRSQPWKKLNFKPSFSN